MPGKVERFPAAGNAPLIAFGGQVFLPRNLNISFFKTSSRSGISPPANGTPASTGARLFDGTASDPDTAKNLASRKWNRFVSFWRDVLTLSRFRSRLPSTSRSLGSESLQAEEVSFSVSGTEAEVPAEHWRSLRRPDVIWEFLDGEAEKRIKTNALDLDGPCLVICGNLTCGRRLTRHFASRGDEAHLVTDVDEAFGVLKGRPDSWSMAILDLDSFGGILELSDDLMDFRVEAPEVPLLLLSSGFSQDDLSEERLPMCDASIRSPAFSLSLTKGVKAAIENNKAWRLRYKSMIY